jgi:hypothetical protein
VCLCLEKILPCQKTFYFKHNEKNSFLYGKVLNIQQIEDGYFYELSYGPDRETYGLYEENLLDEDFKYRNEMKTTPGNFCHADKVNVRII